MTSKFFFSLGGIQVREDSISKEDSFNRNVGNVPLCNEYIYIYVYRHMPTAKLIVCRASVFCNKHLDFGNHIWVCCSGIQT